MTEAVEVTQADRELLIAIIDYASDTIDAILAGNAYTWEVEQIARHRIAHQQDIAAQREDASRQALEAAATVAPSKTAADECETVGQWTRRTLREAIRAIDPARFRGEG